MGSHIQKIIKTLSFSILLSLFFILTACSQNLPEVRNPNYSVIFDYKDSDSYPEARLSVFLESETDVRRYDRIIIDSEESGYIWDFDEITNLEINGIQYTGTASLSAPENEIIPSGTYLVTCVTADQKEKDIYLTVSYDESFYLLKESEALEKIIEKNGRKKIAIYDSDNVLIYFGEQIADLATKRDIWNYYRNAEYYQEIWFISGNRMICIFPAQDVVPEK